MSTPTLTIELGETPAAICGWDDELNSAIGRYFDERPRLFKAVAHLLEAVEAEARDASPERAA